MMRNLAVPTMLGGAMATVPRMPRAMVNALPAQLTATSSIRGKTVGFEATIDLRGAVDSSRPPPAPDITIQRTSYPIRRAS